MRPPPLLLLALAVLLCPLAAPAAGFSFGETGLRALASGGAFAAEADDLTAAQHNPAGLTQLQGVGFLVETQLLNHRVELQRRDAGEARPISSPVQNAFGLFPFPTVGASYGTRVGERPFTAALTLLAPAAVGSYRFPEPNYARNERGGWEQDPRRYAAQRYALIHIDAVLVYPSLSLAYAPHPRLSVGATFQYGYAHFGLSEAVTSMPNEPATQFDEAPELDSVIDLELRGLPTVSGIVGLRYRPTDALTLGASYKPPMPVSARGPMEIRLGETARRLGATVSEGAEAVLRLTMPQELKLGAHLRLTEAAAVAVEAVYQGWQSARVFTLEPQDVSITFGEQSQAMEPILIRKGFRHTWSGRVGGSYAFGGGLTLRAGALFEQGAAPDAFTNIDFLHFTRTFFTAGAEYPLGPLIVALTGALLPTQTKEVSHSEIRQTNTNGFEGGVVGNGTYRSGGYVVGLGVKSALGRRSAPAQQETSP
jgi:long-chain fatty acid transport protein